MQRLSWSSQIITWVAREQARAGAVCRSRAFVVGHCGLAPPPTSAMRLVRNSISHTATPPPKSRRN